MLSAQREAQIWALDIEVVVVLCTVRRSLFSIFQKSFQRKNLVAEFFSNPANTQWRI